MKIKQKTAVIIIGMHRSGTSTVARTANLLGLKLGNTLLPRNEYNPKGYWEHDNLYQVNDKILNFFGFSWRKIGKFPNEWWNLFDIERYKEEIKAIITSDFSNEPLWGVKDPRISILLPLWIPLLKSMSYQIKFIYIYRRPKEVACSLLERDNLCSQESYLLWLLHNISALKYSEGYERCIINYNQLFQDQSATIEKIAHFLKTDCDKSTEDKINGFIDINLRHYQKRNDDHAPKDFILTISDELYQLVDSNQTNEEVLCKEFQKFIKKNESLIMDIVEDKNRVIANFHYKMTSILNALDNEIRQLHNNSDGKSLDTIKIELLNLKNEIISYQSEKDSDLKNILIELREKINQIFSSKAWKLISPLRKISTYLKKLKTT